MIKSVSDFVCLVSLALVLGLAPMAQASTFEERTIERLTQLTKTSGSGVAVLVARDGTIAFQGGFGYADVAGKKKVTPETRFRIGSVSKQFTAALILRLAEQGKLALTDPLSKYFPGFARGNEITLRQMLMHTSGLHSYTDKPGFIERVTQPIEPAKLIEWFRDDAPDFAPGADFHYSNSAYFLLGEIAAKVSGKPLAEVLRTELFEPLGMKATGTYVNAAPPPNAATGYSYAEGKLAPALDWDMSWAGGAGALYSTVSDLFRWNEALFGGRVLSAASLQAATTPVELAANVDGMKYGYGLVMSEVQRMRAVGHGGGLNGWASDLLRLPEQKATVVVLCNAMPPPPGLAPSEISHGLVADFLSAEIEKLPPPQEVTVDAKALAAYAGRYDYQNAVMTVTVEGDGLFAQLTGQPKFRIFPRAADEFFWKNVDAQVTFVRGKEGRVVSARHSQNGNVFTAERLPDEIKTGSGAGTALTPEQLDAFLGQYQYGPGAVLTVTRDGGQLLAQLSGQPQYPIFPNGEDVFSWRVVTASVRFVKDSSGKVVKAVHSQGGATIEAPKVK